MNILKKYEDIVKLLEDNKSKKVSSIMVAVYELTKSKREVIETVRFNDKEEVTHVFCYYHKVWEDVNDVEFGKKTNTKSGLNTMCKEGMKAWTKENNKIKKAEIELRQALLQELLDSKITKEVYAKKEREIPETIDAMKANNNGLTK